MTWGRAAVARRMHRTTIMSVAITEWNLQHTHPHGSWWQYRNDRRFGELTLLGLGIMALVSAALVVWAVLVA